MRHLQDEFEKEHNLRVHAETGKAHAEEETERKEIKRNHLRDVVISLRRQMALMREEHT